jgi:predicted nucleic acid-binding protein
MQIGGHARSEGLIVVTNNLRELAHARGQGRELGLTENLAA